MWIPYDDLQLDLISQIWRHSLDISRDSVDWDSSFGIVAVNLDYIDSSVMSGNCARIRRAFVLGARTLRGILDGSEADVCSVLDQFFKNCTERYDGTTPRPDVAVPRSWPETRIPNGVQRMACMGGGRRSDTARNGNFVKISTNHIPQTWHSYQS